MDIKGVIKSHSHTINSVAVALGMNRVSLSVAINNNPTYGTLKRIADVVGCDVMDFFKDEATHQQQAHCGDFLALVRDGGEWKEYTNKEELLSAINGE